MARFSLSPRTLAWFTGAACVACCTLPLLALALGSTALTGLAFFLEPLAAGLALDTAALLAWRWWVKRQTPACKLDCESRDTPQQKR
jgi:hypothetical protein